MIRFSYTYRKSRVYFLSLPFSVVTGHRTIQLVSMLGPDQVVIWTDLPYPNNPFPAVEFENLGLGGGTQSMFVYVPRQEASQNVHLVEKQMSEGLKGGRTTDLLPDPKVHIKKTKKAKTMRGAGAARIRHAFEHPIKVFLIHFPSLISLACNYFGRNLSSIPNATNKQVNKPTDRPILYCIYFKTSFIN